jgi:ABC-type phosphate/phosphonate transport system substrate-binding protein
VPAAAWSAGQPVYRAEFVVAADAPFLRLDDTFGHRFAFNAVDSHSGYNLPRAHLARWAARAPLFAATVGPTGSHLRSIEMVLASEVEVAAIDSLYLDLARRHAPHLVAGLRTLDVTAQSPIPLFVGGSALTAIDAEALRAALLAFGATGEERKLLADLGLLEFSAVAAERYQATRTFEETAARTRYSDIR